MAHILNVKDEKGEWVGISTIKGADGKSAYEQAKDGGYEGTEEEFIALLNGLSGAIPEAYYTSEDLNTELQSGGGKMIVCCYNENTQNTPYKEGLNSRTHGMVITNAFTSQYATQMCMPSGNSTVFLRELNGGNASAWGRLANNNASDAGGAVGEGAQAYAGGAVGYHAQSNFGGAVGFEAVVNGGGAVGRGAVAKEGFAGGIDAKSTATDAIQLGTGTNPNERTLQVYDYQLMDANGNILPDRLPSAFASETEQLRADIDYIAIMTGVEL